MGETGKRIWLIEWDGESGGRGHIRQEAAEVSGLDGQCCVPWCDILDKNIFVWKRSEHTSKGQVEMKKQQTLA